MSCSVFWRIRNLAVVFFAAALCLTGCGDENEVIVYTALDQEFSERIFDEFTRETGIKVRAKFDSEASKTVGLTNLILAERNRPRCDVFWNNEILNTLRLKSAGVLASCEPTNAKYYPAQYRDEAGYWYGFAARARVLLVNKDLITPDTYPRSVDDLLDTAWADRVGIAKPLFGTTASHAACMFAIKGNEDATNWFAQVAKNARVYPGNKQVAVAVSKGAIAFGLTDTDDSIVAIEDGQPVEIIYPDQGDDQPGTLFIPNTVALIKGAPNVENGKRLINFVLRPETERLLAEGESAQIPLNTETPIPVRVETPNTIKPMSIDFEAAAKKWDVSAKFLRKAFSDR